VCDPVSRALSSSVEAVEAVFDREAIRVRNGAFRILKVRRVNGVQVCSAERQFPDRLIESGGCLMLDARL
jgi:hypothetical protein